MCTGLPEICNFNETSEYADMLCDTSTLFGTHSFQVLTHIILHVDIFFAKIKTLLATDYVLNTIFLAR